MTIIFIFTLLECPQSQEALPQKKMGITIQNWFITSEKLSVGGMFYRGRCKAPTAKLHKTSSGWTNNKNSLKINSNTICQAVYEIIQELKHATNHLDLTG